MTAVGRPGRVVGGLVGAALLIGAVTVLARVVGFGRYLVFARTVGDTCLGTAYLTANSVPNIVFEVVAGGALSSMVVPVVAGALGRGDRAEAARTASALLTWVVVALVPLVLLGSLVAGPVSRVLLGSTPGCDRDAVAAVAARMLLVFLPQVVLYGVAVVAGGVLQSARRFLGPALAPLLSSVVVASAYLAFAAGYEGSRDVLATVPRRSEYVLSVGTTLGVVALALCSAAPLARTGLRLRPTLSFPPGVAGRVRTLAAAGLATVAAQQASVVAVTRLANADGGGGALAVYSYAWAVFLLPWAVLAVPIATSAFPRLSEHAERGERPAYDATVAATGRAVVLASCLGAAVLAAAAMPVARVFLGAGPGGTPPADMARALVAFAPGLVGYGLVAHLGRALYADGKGRAAAAATVTGWAGVVVADIVLVALAPRAWTVAALGLGNTAGMTLAGLLLLRAQHQAGPAALAGLPRAAAAGLVGAAAGGAAGWEAAAAGPPGVVGSVATGLAAAAVAALVLLAVVALLDGGDLRALAGRALARGGRRG